MQETHKQTARLCLVQFVKAWAKTNQGLRPGELHIAYQYRVRNALLYSDNTENIPTTRVSPDLFTSVHLLAVAVTVAGVGLNADERASWISVVSRGYSKRWKHWKKEERWMEQMSTRLRSIRIIGVNHVTWRFVLVMFVGGDCAPESIQALKTCVPNVLVFVCLWRRVLGCTSTLYVSLPCPSAMYMCCLFLPPVCSHWIYWQKVKTKSFTV